MAPGPAVPSHIGADLLRELLRGDDGQRSIAENVTLDVMALPAGAF
jgi:hypothetical protein